MNTATNSLSEPPGLQPTLVDCCAADTTEGPLTPAASISAASRPAGLPAAGPWCLFLDVDGTLLEIAPTPDAVVVEEALREVMLAAREALQGAIALVSGREIAALDALFAPQRWPAAGLHGLERRDAAGCLHLRAVEGRRLDPARASLRDVAGRTPGALLEDKGHALALHYRNAPEHEAELRRAMQGVAAGLAPDFTVLEGKCVLELKPSVATKGDAVREFLREAPFAGRRPIYVGDDVTDLDGFAAVEQAGGLSVAVGDRIRAQRRVASPHEVRALLGQLAGGRGPAS